MSSHCIHDHPPRAKRAMLHPGERSPLEQYGGFIEPRQLSLGVKDVRTHTAMSRDSFMPRSPLDPTHHDRDLDHMGRPYAPMDHARYSPPHRFAGHHPPPEFTIHGSRGDPFLWSGDYGPGTIPGGPDDYLPFDDWVARDPRHAMPYDPPPFFGQHLPGISELVGHHLPLPPMHMPPDRALPPMPHFGSGPMSPFPYDGPPPELFNHPPPQMHEPMENPAQMPLLPFINEAEFTNERRGPPSSPQAGGSENPPPQKKARTSVTQRNAKPLQVEDLLHDHSRFAKVVKAFLSIEVPEARTVPEISKRVSEMYAGQYSDFEAVKRMVNDVLQKHKAFWHPGRGSPYQLNLGEGRARREFPSSRTRGRGGRGGDDDDYFGSGRTTRSKKTRRSTLQEEEFQSQTPSRQGSLEADPDYIPSGGAFQHDPEAFIPEQPYGHPPPMHEELAPGPLPVFEDHRSAGSILTGNLAMILNPPQQDGPHEREPLPIDPALLFATQPPPHAAPLPIDPQLTMVSQLHDMIIKLEPSEQTGSYHSRPRRSENGKEESHEEHEREEASERQRFTSRPLSGIDEISSRPEPLPQWQAALGIEPTSVQPEPAFHSEPLEDRAVPDQPTAVEGSGFGLNADPSEGAAAAMAAAEENPNIVFEQFANATAQEDTSGAKPSPVEALPEDSMVSQDSSSPNAQDTLSNESLLAGANVSGDESDDTARLINGASSKPPSTVSNSPIVQLSKPSPASAGPQSAGEEEVPMELDSGDEDDGKSPRRTPTDSS